MTIDLFLFGLGIGGIVGLICGVTFMVGLYTLGDVYRRRRARG